MISTPVTRKIFDIVKMAKIMRVELAFITLSRNEISELGEYISERLPPGFTKAKLLNMIIEGKITDYLQIFGVEIRGRS